MNRIALKACAATLALMPMAAAPVAMQAQNVVTRTQMENFSNYPAYDGDDLELAIDRNGYHFCLWSPMADSARVNIYKHGQGRNLITTFLLEKDAHTGTWRASSTDDLMNRFYTFQIKIGDRWLDETPGVWAKAVGVNGKRAAVNASPKILCKKFPRSGGCGESLTILRGGACYTGGQSTW